MSTEYLMDRAKEWLEHTKKVPKPALARTLAALRRTAIDTWVRVNGIKEQLKPQVMVSKAKTLGELKRELQDLPDGMGLRVPVEDYSPNQRNELWRTSPHLSQQFGCSAEFRPDGYLWFVKRRS